MRPDLLRLFSFLAVLAVALPASCGGPDDVGASGLTVGGRCSADVDCRHRCLTGGDFPGGYCSVSCRDDRDCPEGTICGEKDGGVCLLACTLPADCHALGSDYTCDAKGRKGIPDAKALVCVGD